MNPTRRSIKHAPRPWLGAVIPGLLGLIICLGCTPPEPRYRTVTTYVTESYPVEEVTMERREVTRTRYRPQYTFENLEPRKGQSVVRLTVLANPSSGADVATDLQAAIPKRQAQLKRLKKPQLAAEFERTTANYCGPDFKRWSASNTLSRLRIVSHGSLENELTERNQKVSGDLTPEMVQKFSRFLPLDYYLKASIQATGSSNTTLTAELCVAASGKVVTTHRFSGTRQEVLEMVADFLCFNLVMDGKSCGQDYKEYQQVPVRRTVYKYRQVPQENQEPY